MNAPPTPTVAYVFDRYELQTAERRLLDGGAPLPLHPRAFDVLWVLAEQAGRLVTKETLLARVWPRVVVEENNLQQQVSVLRKLLGSAAIATVPGSGYRFTLDTRVVPMPAAARLPPHNLPCALTSFIGHEQDLAEHRQLLQHERLLTLVGIGGAGKTRLALQLAQALLPDCGDGVWWVDLSPLQASEHDLDRVAMAVAAALGVRETSGRSMAHTVCQALVGRRLLLVLDNCETALAAAAALAQRLLQASATLRIVATSREALGLAGERVAPVRPLSLPSADAAHDAAHLAGYEAVRLFVDRARLAAPDFVVGPDTARVAADICRQLDGIPLAIELAAARVRLLSLAQIRAMLVDRFRLLVGGGAALSRHQTLLGVVQWSFERLAPDAQRLLCRLAVFAGGWTVDAAAEVAGGGADALDMARSLERLVDLSLVVVERPFGAVVEAAAAAAPRCRMLDSVRQFALAQLVAAGEADHVRDRHLAWSRAFVAAAMPQLATDQAKPWLRCIDAELPNLLEAHAWGCAAVSRHGLALHLAGALFPYLVRRGLMQFGGALFAQTLALPGAQQASAARAGLLISAGEFASVQGAYPLARSYFLQSLEIAQALGDAAAAGVAQLSLGIAAASHGQIAVAQAHLAQALATARPIGDGQTTMLALNSLGELHRVEGRADTAQALYEEALLLSRQRQCDNMSAVVLLNLGVIAVGQQALGAAQGRIREAAVILERTGSQPQWGTLLDAAMGLAAALGDHGTAARLLGAAEAAHARTGRQRDVSDQQFLAPLIARVRAQLGEPDFVSACAAGQALAAEAAAADVQAWLARCHPA